MVDDHQLTEFAARLRKATKDIRPQEKAASMAGVAIATWQRYVKGDREPGFLAIAKLAAEANIDIGWLAYGTKAAVVAKTLDDDLLAQIISLVEAEAISRGSRPPADKLAALIIHCYTEEMRHAGERAAGQTVPADPQAIRRAFRLVG